VAQFQPTHIPVAPVFALEAISPSSVDRDTGAKFAVYEVHGVQEYWILDPEQLEHRFFRREGELLMEFAEGEEIIRAESIPGFFVKRGWLDPERLPSVAAARAEIGNA